jgi:hypothetical protein
VHQVSPRASHQAGHQVALFGLGPGSSESSSLDIFTVGAVQPASMVASGTGIDYPNFDLLAAPVTAAPVPVFCRVTQDNSNSKLQLLQLIFGAGTGPLPEAAAAILKALVGDPVPRQGPALPAISAVQIERSYRSLTDRPFTRVMTSDP